MPVHRLGLPWFKVTSSYDTTGCCIFAFLLPQPQIILLASATGTPENGIFVFICLGISFAHEQVFCTEMLPEIMPCQLVRVKL